MSPSLDQIHYDLENGLTLAAVTERYQPIYPEPINPLLAQFLSYEEDYSTANRNQDCKDERGSDDSSVSQDIGTWERDATTFESLHGHDKLYFALDKILDVARNKFKTVDIAVLDRYTEHVTGVVRCSTSSSLVITTLSDLA